MRIHCLDIIQGRSRHYKKILIDWKFNLTNYSERFMRNEDINIIHHCSANSILLRNNSIIRCSCLQSFNCFIHCLVGLISSLFIKKHATGFLSVRSFRTKKTYRSILIICRYPTLHICSRCCPSTSSN